MCSGTGTEPSMMSIVFLNSTQNMEIIKKCAIPSEKIFDDLQTPKVSFQDVVDMHN